MIPLRLMVMLAWLGMLLISCPQAIIFRVLKHPDQDFYQCTAFKFFDDFSSPVEVGNTTILYLAGLTPVQWVDLYHTIFNCAVFFVPFIIIVVTYIMIYFELKR
jgi:hypothetical protein